MIVRLSHKLTVFGKESNASKQRKHKCKTKVVTIKMKDLKNVNKLYQKDFEIKIIDDKKVEITLLVSNMQ